MVPIVVIGYRLSKEKRKKKEKKKVFTRLIELANYLFTHIFACFPLRSQLHADDLIHLVLAVVDRDADIKTKTEP